MPKIYLPYYESICCDDRLGPKGRETKLIILSAAVSLFIDQGVYQTPVREICAKAGVAKGTFYLYFQTKEAVVDALYEYLYHVMEQAFRQIKAPEPTVEGLEMAIEAIVVHMGQFAELLRFVHRPEVMRISSSAIWSIESQHMLPLLYQWAEAAKANGTIDNSVDPLVVRLMYQMVHDTLEHEFLEPSVDGMEAVLRTVKMMIRRVLHD